MEEIYEVWKIREQAFLLQFEGNEFDVRKKLGLNSLRDYGDPVNAMKQTGLFGILDALIDLGLTNSEIMDFYIHGHVEPYTNPYEFTKGIIEIVYGMPKAEIKNKYGYYLKNDCIEKLPKFNRNTQMLISFCYDKDDTYEFIPNKDDLYDKFAENYYRYNDCDNYINEKEFQKIDGELFRAVRFLVRQGYDFPEMECLLNEQIKSIVFKQPNGKNEFVLNKEYAREMSNDLLSFVCFLKRNNYKFLNPEYMFDSKRENIILIDSSGKQIEFKRAFLESNVNKYNDILVNLNVENLEVSDIISLCDKRVKNIPLWYLNSSGREHRLTIERDILLSISSEWLRVIKKSFNLGFTFPDCDNLFNMNEEILKVIDPDNKEQLVVREQFNSMLDIIMKCKQYDFSINLNQLFDPNECMVELFDKQGKKGIANRDRIIHMMNTFSILTENGYRFKDYDNLFDENKPYIVVYGEQNQERLLSRKQVNKILKVEEASAKNNEENLMDNEKELMFTATQFSTKRKLFKWLPYTAKKWIPSAAVVNKIPAEQSYEYFYNNNYARLGVLKDAYQAKNYEEMEGIVSLGYILGLFDSKESTSEKAMNYIIDYFLKKGVTADELHTTYGAIDLRKGYNKQFADFFMQHYAINSEAFIEPDLGTNMTGELFEKFNEVLENRPEKRIKTRTVNKLLTPIDAMASITSIKIDREMLGEKADDARYICLVTLLTKFGASNSELKWAIKLYEQAFALDEQKVTIPHIEDLKTSLMKFNSHLKSDPQAFISGRKTNCCSKYGGFAEDRLTHVITDPNWRYVTFTSQNRTFFDGLVWYDKKEKVVCIDNVEGQFGKMDKNNTSSIPMMADAVIRYADGIYHKMNELNIPCTKVNVGKDPGTPSWEIFKYAKGQELIFDDNNPCDYPTRNNISTDASAQFTITDEKILKFRRKI